jgi:hypothetical protein
MLLYILYIKFLLPNVLCIYLYLVWLLSNCDWFCSAEAICVHHYTITWQSTVYFKKTGKEQFGDGGVPRRLCIAESQFRQRVCHLPVRIIFRTLTGNWAAPWEPPIYSCVVRAAPYANLVQGAAGSQKWFIDFPVFWQRESRLAMIFVLSVWTLY